MTEVRVNTLRPEHEMERFEREQKLSIYWFNRANDLRGGAGAVWFAMETDGEPIRTMLKMEAQYNFSIATPFVFFLLCGLSLELLYKALAIELGIDPPASHNLRQLAQLGVVTLDDADLELMDLLTVHVVWAGKYPVPRKGEIAYDEAVRLSNEALMDRVPGMSIPMMQRNERLKWPDYARIWDIGAAEYWKRYHLRNEVEKPSLSLPTS